MFFSYRGLIKPAERQSVGCGSKPGMPGSRVYHVIQALKTRVIRFQTKNVLWTKCFTLNLMFVAGTEIEEEERLTIGMGVKC